MRRKQPRRRLHRRVARKVFQTAKALVMVQFYAILMLIALLHYATRKPAPNRDE